jgi:hypothetical protein
VDDRSGQSQQAYRVKPHEHHRPPNRVHARRQAIVGRIGQPQHLHRNSLIALQNAGQIARRRLLVVNGFQNLLHHLGQRGQGAELEQFLHQRMIQHETILATVQKDLQK